METGPLFSVLIVNYNGKVHLPECLDSLRKQAFRDFEVVVVDNASRDGSADFVTANYPEVTLVQSDRNRGFSGGNNFGLPHCRGRFIFFLNNDVRVDPAALAELAAATKAHPDVHIFASFLVNYGNPALVDSAGDSVYTCGKGFSFTGYPVSLFTAPRFVTAACAGAAAYSRSVLDRVGAFDEDFFLNFEDLDLSFRSQHAGERILFIPASKVFHKGSASLGGKKSALSLYYQERNYLLFVLKNWPWPDLLRFIPSILFVKAWGLLDCLRFGRFGSWVRGNLAGLRLLPGALRKRKAILGTSKLGPGGFRTLLRKNWLREKISFYRGRYDTLS
jgi:GT2 family glycosyltransferase